MNKQAYDQGFIAACNANGIDPQELIKVAQLGKILELAGKGGKAISELGNKALYNKYTEKGLVRLGVGAKRLHRKLFPAFGKTRMRLSRLENKLFHLGRKQRLANKPLNMLGRFGERASTAIGDFNEFGSSYGYGDYLQTGGNLVKRLGVAGAGAGATYGGYKLNKRRLANR